MVVVAALAFGAILSHGDLGVSPWLAGDRLSPHCRGLGVLNPIEAALKATGYCFGLSARKLMKAFLPRKNTARRGSPRSPEWTGSDLLLDFGVKPQLSSNLVKGPVSRSLLLSQGSLWSA